jgi:hypothetical protein
MDSHTFRSRLARLIQKSRKALRLYSNVGSLPNEGGSEFTEMQVNEWKRINADLLHHLTAAVENPSHKQLTVDICALRERFQVDWRMAESEMHRKQRELIAASEHGDFIKASLLSNELVVIKARTQASQAAHHELSDVVKQSRPSQPTIELSNENVVLDTREEEEYEEPRQAKVIPLRKRQ